MDGRKVVLCYPAINRFHRERKYHWFPFSVLPLAQALRAHDYQPVVIDYRVEANPFQKLSAHLKDALLVGISTMSGYQIAGALRIAKTVKKLKPSIPVVWGGWHPTILPEETAKHPLVDIAVVGNGERTIVEIVDTIKSKGDVYNIKGVAYRNEKGVVFTGYKVQENMQDDAKQYGNFVDIPSYINPETRALGYFSGHGCIFKCAFCSRHFMTKRYSPYTVEKVIDDIGYFVTEYGFRKIHFQDDNFFLNPKRALQIARQFISAGSNLKWWANIRADIIHKLNREEIEVLVRSGLTTLFIGAESGSQHLLDIMNKGTKADDILKTNAVMKNYSIDLHISYMFGVPGDTVEDMKSTVNQIRLLRKENKNVHIQTCFYQPYPGTELYKKALESGYARIRDLEGWARLKPQQEFDRIPWLSNKEMKLYRKEFNDFLKFN